MPKGFALAGVAGYDLSPDGTRVAFWKAFQPGDPDAKRAVRLYCVDVRDGEEALVEEGDGEVRALAWVSDDLLLVQREVRGEVLLALHAMPDGGLVASRTVREHRVAGRIQFTPDRRLALWLPVTLERAEPIGTAQVFALPDLAPRATVEHVPAGSVRHRVSSMSGAAIEPDGSRVAVSLSRGAGWRDNSVGDLQVFPVRGRSVASVSVEGITNAPLARIAWLDADSVAVLRDDERAEHVTLVEGLRKVNARAMPLTTAPEITVKRRPLGPFCVDVARRSVFCVLGRAGDESVPCHGALYRVEVDTGEARLLAEATFAPKLGYGLRVLPGGRLATLTCAREERRLALRVEVFEADGARVGSTDIRAPHRQRVSMPQSAPALVLHAGPPRNLTVFHVDAPR